MSPDDDRLARVAKLCEEAVELLGRGGSFRLRTLLKMVLIEAAKAKASGSDDAPSRTPPAP